MTHVGDWHRFIGRLVHKTRLHIVISIILVITGIQSSISFAVQKQITLVKLGISGAAKFAVVQFKTVLKPPITDPTFAPPVNSGNQGGPLLPSGPSGARGPSSESARSNFLTTTDVTMANANQFYNGPQLNFAAASSIANCLKKASPPENGSNAANKTNGMTALQIA